MEQIQYDIYLDSIDDWVTSLIEHDSTSLAMRQSVAGFDRALCYMLNLPMTVSFPLE